MILNIHMGSDVIGIFGKTNCIMLSSLRICFSGVPGVSSFHRIWTTSMILKEEYFLWKS
jgi:hypothetical protein